MAINLSVPGLVLKLQLFGIAGAGFGAAKIVGWIYTVVLLWVTLWTARRVRPGAEPLAWLALLILATLRSPFLPAVYGVFPALWLLGLLAASHTPTRKTLVLTIVAWIALTVYVPVDTPIDPRWFAGLSLLAQISLVAVTVLGLRRACAA